MLKKFKLVHSRRRSPHSDTYDKTSMKHNLPCVFLSLFLPAAAERPGNSQAPFNKINPCSSEPEQRLKSVLTSEFDEYISYMMDLWSVKGISVAVVRPGSDPEYGAWGGRSEDGERMTVDVSE